MAVTIVRAPCHNFSHLIYLLRFGWFGYNLIPNNSVSTQLKFPLEMLIPRGDIALFWWPKLWQHVQTLAILRPVA